MGLRQGQAGVCLSQSAVPESTDKEILGSHFGKFPKSLHLCHFAFWGVALWGWGVGGELFLSASPSS